MAYLYKRVKTKHKDFITRVKCFYYNPEASKKGRGVRRKSTGVSKQERNRLNSYKRKQYLIYNNFDIGDLWITLTYNKDNIPGSPEEAHKVLRDTLGNIRKKLAREKIPFVYYAKTEAGEKTRVHHHLFIKNNFNVISVLYDYWKQFGKVYDFREIYNFKSGKLVKYFLDGGDHKGLDFEKYTHSRNLKEPEIEIRIMPFESFRERPKIPKSEDGARYIIHNLYNGCPDSSGYVYQEYELIKVKDDEEWQGPNPYAKML